MKVAGQKNPGAWYRANKFIRFAPVGANSALQDALMLSEFGDAAYNAIVALAAQVGAPLDSTMDSKEEWIHQLAYRGIPWQVWNGHLSFTTYTAGSSGGGVPDGTYTANYQSEMHYFAKDLRKIMKRFVKGNREVMDLLNFRTRAQGNPGGIADADKTT